MKLRKGPEHAVAVSEPTRIAPPQGGTPTANGQGRTLLGELLVSSQLITHDQLAEALIQQSTSGKRIGTILVELGAIGERDLAKALSTQLHVPLVDLSQQTPTPEAIELLPESVARAHLAVPIVVDDSRASPSPSRTRTPSWPRSWPTHAAGSSASSSPRDPTSSAPSTPPTGPSATSSEHVRAFEETDDGPRRATATPACRRCMADDAPVVQVVNLLITQAMRDRASDIHIEPQDERPARPVPHRRRPARRRRTSRWRWRPPSSAA